jgi:hypothetical protein
MQFSQFPDIHEQESTAHSIVPDRYEGFDDDDDDLFPDETPYTEVEPVTVSMAALGFTIVTAGISTLTSGDLKITRPAGQIGVRMPRKPNLQWNYTRRSRLIINHRVTSRAGVELVNVKMRCNISYSGPEVLASFGFDAGGKRSRLMNDTDIRINNPLPLRATRAPEAWRKIGIRFFPVIEIPIEFRIDHPWPTSNRNETFSLVLSGNKGFGADGRRAIIRRNVVRN